MVDSLGNWRLDLGDERVDKDTMKQLMTDEMHGNATVLFHSALWFSVSVVCFSLFLENLRQFLNQSDSKPKFGASWPSMILRVFPPPFVFEACLNAFP